MILKWRLTKECSLGSKKTATEGSAAEQARLRADPWLAVRLT